MLMDLSRLLKPVTAAALTLGMASSASAEFRLHPYAAAGAGFVRLSPDPGDSGLSVTESNSFGYNILLGVDFADRWALEAGYNDLGTATLNNPAVGDQEISYSALSLSTVFHLFGDSRDIAERDGSWTYLRFGVNKIDNESELELEEANNTAIWVGLGFEWAMTSMVSLRGEIASFDGDVQALTAGVVFRPFDSRPRSTPAATPTPTPAPAPAPQATTKPAPLPAPAPTPLPSVETIELPTTIAAPTVAPTACETPVSSEPFDLNGCARFSGVRRDIQFIGESAKLTPESAVSLAKIANDLNTTPGIRIEVRAHAQSIRGVEAAQTLSKQRVVAVARALVNAGVSVERLGARAFGSKDPAVKQGALQGQVIPDRIEFLVIP